jgi:hypothetical protein
MTHKTLHGYENSNPKIRITALAAPYLVAYSANKRS